MRRRWWLGLVAAGAVVLGACGGTSTSEKLDFVDDVTSISADIDSGALTIDGSGTETTVEVEVSYEGTTAPTYRAELQNGVLTLIGDCADITTCSVDFTVTLSDETADVDVSTGDGGVTIASITGSVSVAAGDGDILLNTIAGDLTVDGGAGKVLGARIESTTATVTMADGDIDVSFDEPVTDLTITAQKGDATAQVPGGPYNVSTDAPNGSVDIKIATDPNAPLTITMSAATGNITIYAK